MTLTLRQTTNGAWVFTPSSGKSHRSGKPKMKDRDGFFSFEHSNGDTIVKDVPYADITIIEADATEHDTWASADEVIDKLAELNFFFSVSGGVELGYTEYVASLTQTGSAAPVATILKNTLGYEPAYTRTGTGQYAITLQNLNVAKTDINVQPRCAAAKRLIISQTLAGNGAPVIRTWNDATPAYEDDMLVGGLITIKVYP